MAQVLGSLPMYVTWIEVLASGFGLAQSQLL